MVQRSYKGATVFIVLQNHPLQPKSPQKPSKIAENPLFCSLMMYYDQWLTWFLSQNLLCTCWKWFTVVIMVITGCSSLVTKLKTWIYSFDVFLQPEFWWLHNIFWFYAWFWSIINMTSSCLRACVMSNCRV